MKDSSIHTGIKPYIHFFSAKYTHVADSHRIFKFIYDDAALDAAFYKHLIRIEPRQEKLRLYLDPLLNFEVAKDLNSKISRNFYVNTRGFIGSGYIGNKVYFESLFSENQAVLPDYLARQANSTTVIPGQGRWKKFKSSGYDYAFSSGFVSIQILKQANLQLGHGKQKIGNGYRSLLLSDNAFNYPYLRLTQQWLKSKVQYSIIYSVLTNMDPATKVLTAGTERLFQKKAASFQYLSCNLSKSVNLGFFQGLIWQAGDYRNQQHLDWQYFNPIIYANLFSYKLNSKNNLLIGSDLKIKLTNKLNIYGQLMVDDLNNKDTLGNDYGFQSGFNWFDAIGIKNFFVQAEYNYVSEGSYRNVPGSLTNQSYSHTNQNLAYTPGYGQELIFIADYKYKRIMFNLKYNYQDIPLKNKNYYYTNTFNARIGYLINPAYNLNISLGITYRNQYFHNFKTLNNEMSYIYLGLRTSLYNLNYDF